jgi:predicted lipoprotein with Yx(FWY)xxD motif
MRALAVSLVALIAATSAGAAPSRAKVQLHTTSVGVALADAHGRALFVRSLDSRTSTCYGACASAWPPFLTTGRPLAGAGVKQSLLVTYAGRPLYYHDLDVKPGTITGQGAASTWWLIGSSGQKITKLPNGGYIGTTT